MTNFSIMTQKGTEFINQVLNTTDKKIMADGWYISLGTGKLEPTENTDKLINPVFGKNDCLGVVFGEDSRGHYAEILIPKDILKYHITEIGLFNNEDLLITVAKTDINLSEDYDYDVRQRIYIKAIPDGDGVKCFNVGCNNSLISYLFIPIFLFSITFFSIK